MEFMQDLPDLVRLLVALTFVVGLMGGLAFVLKRLGLAGAAPTGLKSTRLHVLEKLQLDARRQLILLERDDAQHLVILGINGETVIETNIQSKGEELS